MIHTLNSSNIFRSWTVKKGKARVYGRSLAGIAGSIPAGDMDVCLLWVFCFFRQSFLRRPGHSSRCFLQNVGVSEYDFETSALRRLRYTRAVEP